MVLGTGKQEAEPKLLLLMRAQKDKYEKWLFRVLLVLTNLMVRIGFQKRIRRVDCKRCMCNIQHGHSPLPLFLMILLGVTTMNQVCNPAVGRYVSKIQSHEMLPWADWITKHLNDSVVPSRVKEEDLVQIKENLRY